MQAEAWLGRTIRPSIKFTKVITFTKKTIIIYDNGK